MLSAELYMDDSHSKRCVDLAGSVLLLGALGAPTLVAAGIIRAIEGQPALFRNTRFGKGWTTLQILKLTTMVGDAHLHEQHWQNDSTDPRITRVGRYIRAMNLNEVPSLINVINGDMHLVGAKNPTQPALDRMQAADGSLFDEWQSACSPYSFGWVGPGILAERRLVKAGDLQAASIGRMRAEIDYLEHRASPLEDARILASVPLELARNLARQQVVTDNQAPRDLAA